nr:hypothetical protein [Tanacetum cinerariifolium]
MNYPRFTKVIIDYFMTRKPSISRRNRIHWHYVRDDALFSTIKVEYYACAMREAAPKPKASARKKKGDSASSTTLPTPTSTTTAESAPRLSTSAKEVGSHEEGNESNDGSDDGSDNDSEETVKSGAGKDGDDDDDKDNDDDDEEEETAKDDEE